MVLTGCTALPYMDCRNAAKLSPMLLSNALGGQLDA